eukprot:1196109-Prorocentrum_minimum.AAC.4
MPGLARRSDKPSAAREASPRGSVGGGRASSRKFYPHGPSISHMPYVGYVVPYGHDFLHKLYKRIFELEWYMYPI